MTKIMEQSSTIYDTANIRPDRLVIIVAQLTIEITSPLDRSISQQATVIFCAIRQRIPAVVVA